MQYRRLGNSNLRVSTLCLGTMMFGKQTPFEEAARIVASARDHGLNFIDTADVYNHRQSETDVGKLLAGQRQQARQPGQPGRQRRPLLAPLADAADRCHAGPAANRLARHSLSAPRLPRGKARGVLTGKYPPGQPPAEGTRAGAGDKCILETEFREESLLIAQKIKARCDARGLLPGQFAAAWVLANPLVSSVIVGPRTLAHLEQVYGAVDLVLGPDDEAFVNALVVAGHSSSPGYNDPAYPFFGRPV